MMAKADGIFSKLRGKVGGVVFYVVDGKTYVRQHIDEPKISEPTPLQQVYRNKFGMASHFLRPLKIPIEFGFQAFRKGMRTGMNVAMGYTVKNAFYGGGVDPLQLIPAQVKLSMGSLTGARNAQVSWVDDEQVSFSWENNIGEGSAGHFDQAMLVLYNAEDQRVEYVLEGDFRSAGQQEVKVLRGKEHEGKLHAYISFHHYSRRYKTREFSDSQYLGMV
ncbi:DUF6266 family protein [Echinicola salinicaeni]|uniref:DUF6266 family protein n=1 Tax=Echinicola salinicaeni TaxID=2762757 RepID=UPI001648A347|nr:DUF6266 family protein [Echinicola salinicaeni]